MILGPLFLLGFVWGFWRAQKRGGDIWDRLRYGLAHALAITLTVFAIVAFLDFTGWAW